MLKSGDTNRSQESEVAIRDNLIVVLLRGKQTKQLAQDVLSQFQAAVAAQRAKDKKILVLIDVRTLSRSDITSDARLAMKTALKEPIDQLAAVGKSRLMETALYLFRSEADKAAKSRYFTSESEALRWLNGSDVKRKRLGTGLLVAAWLIALTGVATLLGWALDNAALTRLVEALRPINPLASIGLILVGIGLGGVWARKRRVVEVAARLVIVIGLLALLPIGVDRILFSDQVRAIGVRADLADSAAFSFIAVGLSLLLAEATSRRSIVARHILAVTILVLGVVNVFGLLYARDGLYGISDTFAMALPLALVFVLCGTLLGAMTVHRNRPSRLPSITRSGWLIVAILLLVQVVMYATWRQNITQNQREAAQALEIRANDLAATVQTRIQAYVDALYGFKGLFASSEFVNHGEFEAYYQSSNLAQNYPGFRTISFISVVNEADLPAFVAARRNDTSINPEGNPDFTIQQRSNSSTHYIITYLANNRQSPNLGNDLADDPARVAAYTQAFQTNAPAASSTIVLEATTTGPAGRGFFISIPLERGGSASRTGDREYIGIVNTVFNYDRFFEQVLGKSPLIEGLDVSITDAADGAQIFRAPHSDDSVFEQSRQVAVANRTWDISLHAPATFGTTETQRSLPSAVLIMGQLLSLLLITVFAMQTRARQRTLKLAEDITADLQHERNRAVALQQKDEAVLSSIGDAVFAIDMHERITLFNPAVQQISGYTEQEALGRPYGEILKFVYDKSGKPNTDFIKEAQANRVATMVEDTYLVRKDGKHVAVADSAAPIRDAKGHLQGVIVIFRDISQEQELDRAKNEFVSLASHQLRTPLSAINWYGEMLLAEDAGKLNKDQKEYATEIYAGSQRMSELVNALLDVSRIEVGKIGNKPVDMSIVEIADSVHKELVPTITEKKQTFVKDIESNVPRMVADPKLIRMVVQNLLSNAVKYTPAEGSVTLALRHALSQEVKAADLSGQEKYLFMSVSDTGYGIPEAQKDKIFGKLFRADNVQNMNLEGTGLGLYIVKEVVEKMQGKVWFESKESVGTTFYVLLPFDTSGSAE